MGRWFTTFGISAQTIAIAAVLLSIPSLWVGFVNDDFIHRLALSGVWAGYQRDALSVYDFVRGGSENTRLIESGMLPWFAEPSLTFRFFRPLSSVLLAFDAVAFGTSALAAHVHSLLWFALTVFLVFKLHRRMLPRPASDWATLVFAVAGSHVDSLSWIAARHVLVSGALGLGAWYAQVCWQQDRRAALRWLAPALLVAALFASEAALSAVPFLLWHAGFASTEPVPVRERVRRMVPVALVTLVYLALYAWLGFGTHQVGSYVSPFDSPGRFALAVAERLPLLASELFTGAPAALSYAGTGPKLVLWINGCLSAALIIAVVLRRRAALEGASAGWLWMPAALAASLIPMCGTILDGRLLLVPMAASSLFVGFLLSRTRAAAPSSRALRVWGYAGLGLLFVLHLGLSPLVRVAFALGYRTLGHAEQNMPVRAELDCAADSRVVVVNGSDPAIGLYAGPVFAWREGPRRPGFHVLTMAQNDLRLERSGERSLTLTVVGTRRTHFIEALYRPPDRPLRSGDRVVLSAFTATVLDADALAPTRVKFDFATALESPALCFARWEGGAEGRLVSIALSDAPVTTVRYEPGPLGL